MNERERGVGGGVGGYTMYIYTCIYAHTHKHTYPYTRIHTSGTRRGGVEADHVLVRQRIVVAED